MNGQILVTDGQIDAALARFGSDQLRDLGDHAGAIASTTARLAVERADVEDIRRLRELERQFARAETPNELRRTDSRLHIGIGVAAQSPRLTAAMAKIHSDLAPLSWGSSWVGRRIGVFIELIAAVGLVIALLFHIKQPVSVLFATNHTGDHNNLGYLGAFLVASLASGFVMFGFDTASSLGEEATDPKKGSPKSILRAVTASFVLGGAILLLGILSAENINDPKISASDGGLQYLVLRALGQPVGTLFLVAIGIAITVCALAVHAACIRAVFAMARDNNLPFARQLSR